MISIFLAMAIAFASGCGQEQVNTDTLQGTSATEAIVVSEAYIQINDTKLMLNEATVKDFVDIGASFGLEDIDNNEALNWTINANQHEILVYLDDALELTLNRADSGVEKSAGDCIVGGVEVRLLDVDVLSTDINSLPSYANIEFNEGIVFGDTVENALAAYGTPIRDFVADYGEVSVRQLDFECDEYNAYCQIKDGRIYCFIISSYKYYG